jgi:hypothetical protein
VKVREIMTTRVLAATADHVANENDLLLPALTDSGADLAALLADMHQMPAGAQA